MPVEGSAALPHPGPNRAFFRSSCPHEWQVAGKEAGSVSMGLLPSLDKSQIIDVNGAVDSDHLNGDAVERRGRVREANGSGLPRVR